MNSREAAQSAGHTQPRGATIDLRGQLRCDLQAMTRNGDSRAARAGQAGRPVLQSNWLFQRERQPRFRSYLDVLALVAA